MPDAIVSLKNDHKEVERLFKRFEKLGPGAHKEKGAVVAEIVRLLAVHAAVEEQQFYPAVRAASEELESDVLEGLEEHHIVKWTLSELADLAPDAERFDAKVTVLIESVRHHVEEEETELFPAVRKAMGRAELVELGKRLDAARAVAPTKPHPKAADTPPLNLVQGLTAAVTDRSGDAVRAGAKRGLGRIRRG